MKVAVGNTFVKIDDEDFNLIAEYKWFPKNSGTKIYPCTYLRVSPTKKKDVIMSKIVLGVDYTTRVTFVNGNPLDCRKSNLMCTSLDNNNVTWISDINKWKAEITLQEVTYFLGFFNTQFEALKEVKRVSDKHFIDG